MSFFLSLALEERLHYVYEVGRCLYLLAASCFDDSCSYAPGVAQFAVQVEDVCKCLLLVFVYDIGSSLARSFVHSHVERRVEAEGEASALIIEMMARYTQVGKQPVNTFLAIVAHPVLQVSEVGAYEGEVLIGDDVLFGVGVLVEAVQVTVVGYS